MLEFLAHTQTQNWDRGKPQNCGNTDGFGYENAAPVLGTKTRLQFWVPYLKFNRSPLLGTVSGTQIWGRVLVPKTASAFRFGPRNRLGF